MKKKYFKPKVMFYIICIVIIIYFNLVISKSLLGIIINQEITNATVINITSEERKTSKHRKQYTNFSAEIEYIDISGTKWQGVVSGGNIDGWNQSLNSADYKIGDEVKISYDSKNPRKISTNIIKDLFLTWAILFAGILIFILDKLYKKMIHHKYGKK